MSNVLTDAQANVKNACDFLGLDQGVYSILAEPQKIVELNIPLKMDDGSVKTFKAYRGQHNNAAGPFKGGLRYHQDVNLDEVKALSLWMTIKCQIAGLPYGGGKGGIAVDPKTLSQGELERLTRSFTNKIASSIGSDVDIMAPDVNTNGQIMSWITDQYEKITGQSDPAIVTGKPIEIGGSLGRTEATGFGVGYTTLKTLEKLEVDTAQATVALQGFGNVGSFTAKYLYDNGVRVLAIAGHDKGEEFAIYKKFGININDLIEFRKTNRNLKEFPDVDIIPIEDFWSMEVDVLIPAALENVLNKETAPLVNAKAVVEAANGPTTSEGDQILADKEIMVVPDVLANSGGVIVSYFEWVQNKSGDYWTTEKVLEKEYEKLKTAFNNIYDFMEEKKISFRNAAYIYAIDSLNKKMKLRGWI